MFNCLKISNHIFLAFDDICTFVLFFLLALALLLILKLAYALLWLDSGKDVIASFPFILVSNCILVLIFCYIMFFSGEDLICLWAIPAFEIINFVVEGLVYKAKHPVIKYPFLYSIFSNLYTIAMVLIITQYKFGIKFIDNIW